ncbi:peptidase S8 (plasmid) [Bacillus thuringiensis serovar coreanensis]|nr:peptidase S8 [Bacillus thuringiensis serovar coreanensis]
MKLFKKIILLSLFLSFILPFGHIKAEETTNYYTILLNKQENMEDVEKRLNAHNAQVTYKVEEVGLLQVKTSETALKELSSKNYIKTYNRSVKTNVNEINNASDETDDQNSDDIFSKPSLWDVQWDMQSVTHNGESYNVFSGTKKVSVGIIDSGIDINHPDLKDNIIAGSKNLVPSGGFRNGENRETGNMHQINDTSGHGTLVAGQIAANGKLKGVAPGIGIKSYRVLGKKSAENIWIIKGIVEAAKDDVDVINISLGDYLVDGMIYSENGRSVNDLAEIEGYKRAIKFARDKGSVVVSAAGNDSLDVKNDNIMNEFLRKKFMKEGTNFKGKIFDVPASLPEVVTVSSVGPTNDFSVFSNYGSGFIDIAAPGGDLKLLQAHGENDWINSELYKKETILSTSPGGYFFTYGNSLAAPKVSGALALIIDQNNYKNQPDKAINFLYEHGVNYTSKNTSFYGHGVLDIYKALTFSIINK